MSGLAQQLFYERMERPWSETEDTKEWSLLDQLLKVGILSPLDITLAEELLPLNSSSEALAAAICHLSLATRHGHLCTRREGQHIVPPSQQLFGEEQGAEASAGLAQRPISEWANRFDALVAQGHQQLHLLPADFISPGSDGQRCLCIWDKSLYLQRQWHYEEVFSRHLKRLLGAAPTIQLDSTYINDRASLLYAQGILESEQAEAVKRLCGTSLTLISGGPGTGKTYTAGQMIEAFWQALSQEQRQTAEVILAAPTGKAASNLLSSLGRVASSLQDFPEVQSCTLHSLLKIHQQHGQQVPSFPTLTADLLIVDECSMIDVKLMAHLFASVKEGARLILLGDPDQLPPVDSGGLFSDLVLSPLSETLGVKLSACRRTDAQEIISFANAIHFGDVEAVEKSLRNDGVKAIESLFLEGTSTRKRQQSLLQQTLPYFPDLHPLDEPLEVLRGFQSFRLLTPLRQGPWGVDSLNNLLLHASHVRQRQRPFVVPILITQNDYRTQLFNGETGVLVRYSPLKELNQPGRVDRLFDERDYALFPSTESQKDVRRLAAVELPKFEYAYSISVHKSQGSEFDHVALLLPEGSEVFGREVLYTAVTRAKKRVSLHSEPQTLRKVLSRTSHRLSGMQQRMQALI